MIRINLLPLRASRKKETVRQQVSILALSFGGVLLVGICLYLLLLAKISTATAQIESSEAEIRALKAKIGAIDNIKKLQAEVKKKLDVLSQLRREKSGPASRLAALSDAVPPRLWLTKYVESGSSVSVSGYALNEELIALFLRNLAAGPFTGVELLVSEQVSIAGETAKRFDIVFQLKKP
jgi:type IV pilus assembly protein PilN